MHLPVSVVGRVKEYTVDRTVELCDETDAMLRTLDEIRALPEIDEPS